MSDVIQDSAITGVAPNSIHVTSDGYVKLQNINISRKIVTTNQINLNTNLFAHLDQVPAANFDINNFIVDSTIAESISYKQQLTGVVLDFSTIDYVAYPDITPLLHTWCLEIFTNPVSDYNSIEYTEVLDFIGLFEVHSGVLSFMVHNYVARSIL